MRIEDAPSNWTFCDDEWRAKWLSEWKEGLKNPDDDFLMTFARSFVLGFGRGLNHYCHEELRKRIFDVEIDFLNNAEILLMVIEKMKKKWGAKCDIYTHFDDSVLCNFINKHGKVFAAVHDNSINRAVYLAAARLVLE